MYTENLKLAGNYTLALVGTFGIKKTKLNNQKLVEFNITLNTPPRTFVPEVKYEFITIKDHSMDIAEGWTFEIGGPFPLLGKYGDVLSLEVNLGKARSFANFNKTSKTLTIEEGALSTFDVGRYTIIVLARYSYLNFTENYKTSFTLVIGDDNKIVPPEPEKVLTLHQWTLPLNNT